MTRMSLANELKTLSSLSGGIHQSAVAKTNDSQEEKMKRDAGIRGLMETLLSKIKA